MATAQADPAVQEEECIPCKQAEVESCPAPAPASASAGDSVDPKTAASPTAPKASPKGRERKKLEDDKNFAPALPTEAPALPTPGIIIEYCDRSDAPAEEHIKPLPAGLRGVTILPRTAHDQGGIFRVWLTTKTGDAHDPAHIPEELQTQRDRVTSTLLWDRKTEGRFPEPKELKQKIRDIIAPAQSLGHSDKKS
ncbi:hypothetical protein OC842_002937 [Tilletia horrida]|uniref:Uncharacterized protein n=1 Tax=Tilletia horrida TaxID=155126 RepID=A0AAN6GCM7_9BASI|nr:hypothetical protein OC842_002937 [Tilletia horrida]